MKEWFYAKDGQPIGPVEKEELRDLYNTNQLSENVLVWKEGMENWIHYRDSELYITPPPHPVEEVLPELPMKWFKFEANFAVFATGIINVFTGIFYLSGIMYGERKLALYTVLPALGILDKVYGLLLILSCIGFIYIGLRLRKLVKDSWKNYLKLVVLVGCLSIIYGVLTNIILQTNVFNVIFGNVVGLFVGTYLRYLYYKKRDHLFIN